MLGSQRASTLDLVKQHTTASADSEPDATVGPPSESLCQHSDLLDADADSQSWDPERRKLWGYHSPAPSEKLIPLLLGRGGHTRRVQDCLFQHVAHTAHCRVSSWWGVQDDSAE